MSHVRFECFYCGHRFGKYFYSADDLDGLCCPQCRDTRLKQESDGAGDKDPFGYNYDERTGKK